MSERPADIEILRAILEEIREGQYLLVAEVRGLRGDLAGRGAEPQADAATVAMLTAIRANCGDYVFTCADLAEHCTLPAKADLRAAIVAAIGSLQPRRIGKALRNLEGRDVQGLAVYRHGSGRDGIEWRVSNSR